MEELLKQLVASGPIGVIAAIAIYIAWQKDKQIAELNERMLGMQEKMLDRYHGAIGEVNTTVRLLADELDHEREAP